MLALLVGDALNGVDVICRHHRLYALLLAEPALHACFIAGLAQLETRKPAAAPGRRAGTDDSAVEQAER
jgi:hypothetical protein